MNKQKPMTCAECRHIQWGCDHYEHWSKTTCALSGGNVEYSADACGKFEPDQNSTIDESELHDSMVKFQSARERNGAILNIVKECSRHRDKDIDRWANWLLDKPAFDRCIKSLGELMYTVDRICLDAESPDEPDELQREMTEAFLNQMDYVLGKIRGRIKTAFDKINKEEE